MYGYNLVAIYESMAEAERVRARLTAAGIPNGDIRVSRAEPAPAEADYGERQTGFFGWLFGDAPERDRDWYANNLREDRAAVSVRIADGPLHQRARDIMEECNPVDLDDEPLSAPAMPVGAPARPAAGTAIRGERMEEGERVIPVVKEELSVGKRATERRYRVKTYVIERPVEETVTLRDERVEIEHRPVSDDGRRAAVPRQGEMEIIERHEEPVVEKRGRAVEEVVVRKEVTERPETVRGTVQETKVEVEKDAAATGRGSEWAVKPAGTATPAANPQGVAAKPSTALPNTPVRRP